MSEAVVLKKKPGRRPIDIPLVQLEALCQIHATDEEIAAHFGCSTKTIERLKKKAGYRETFRRGRSDGLISLRRAQYQHALRGSPSMLIWLGKQMLGQKDRVEHGGSNGTPARLDQVRELLLSLSDEDFAKLAAEHGISTNETPSSAMTIDVVPVPASSGEPTVSVPPSRAHGMPPSDSAGDARNENS